MNFLKAHALDLVIVAALAAFVAMWNREHRARGEAERQAEAAELKLKGQIVEDQTEAKGLREYVSSLLAESDLLRAKYDEARKAAPDAKPVQAAHFKTGSIKVPSAGTPLPGSVEGTPRSVSNPPPSLGGHSGESDQEPAGGNGPPAPASCVLKEGDGVGADVEIVELQTEKGNLIAVGTLQVYREDPPPKTLVLGGQFSSPVSTVEGLKPRPEPGFGIALEGAVGPHGASYGLGVLLPPFRVLGARLEPAVALLRGADTLVVGSLGVRF